VVLYAIADLHFSSSVNKPMDIFGKKWEFHDQKIIRNWLKNVTDEDTVLIPGDISWGMNLEEAKTDLELLQSLPGRKILLKGNHDFWWNSVTKLKNSFPGLNFLQNNFYKYKDWAICGTRGWSIPGSPEYSEHDWKIYQREILRLEMSLADAKKHGYEKIICMMHYPPKLKDGNSTGFIDIFETYKVAKVVYGHLHGDGFSLGIDGPDGEVTYCLVSADYLNFAPRQIIA
jgi:hypothetical protein